MGRPGEGREQQQQQQQQQAFELDARGNLIESVAGAPVKDHGPAALTPLQQYMIDQQSLIARDVLDSEQQLIFDRGQARIEACVDPAEKRRVMLEAQAELSSVLDDIQGDRIRMRMQAKMREYEEAAKKPTAGTTPAGEASANKHK